jgi:hypothetical protein
MFMSYLQEFLQLLLSLHCTLQINLMQLCFFQVANASGQPNLWWDYVDMFGHNCTMKNKQYTEECARRVREIAVLFLMQGLRINVRVIAWYGWHPLDVRVIAWYG